MFASKVGRPEWRQYMENDGLQPFRWRLFRFIQHDSTHQIPVKFSPRVLFVTKVRVRRALVGAIGSQNLRVHVVHWELSAVTATVVGADWVLVTQPEKHCWGMDAGGVIRQPSCTRTLLQRSSPPDVRWSKRWIWPGPHYCDNIGVLGRWMREYKSSLVRTCYIPDFQGVDNPRRTEAVVTRMGGHCM